MVPRKVIYSKLFNLGNYENERVEIEVEIEPGESPHAAYARARAWVEAHDPEKRPKRLGDYDRDRLQAVLADPENHSPKQIKEAEARLAADATPNEDDIPF